MRWLLITALRLPDGDLDAVLEPHNLLARVDLVDDEARILRPLRLAFKAVARLE